MTRERWAAVKRLFHDALERAPSERAAYAIGEKDRDRLLIGGEEIVL